MDSRRVIIDTDTAGDDTQAILMSVLSDRITVEGLSIVAGNVEFDYEVENAKHTLQLVDAADDIPVYEGARSPLLKEYEHADEVHGEGGLGGDLFPDTGVESAHGHAVDFIVDSVRENPGEITLLCIGPLTNVALALQREPDLNDYVDEVWAMGGAVNTAGNVTPAAEFNFWVDPDAAKRVIRELDVTIVDWGLCLDTAVVPGDRFDEIREMDTVYSDFFLTIAEPVLEFTRDEQGIDGVTEPDSLAAALMLAPELRETVNTYYADVDEREGMTRGYSLVDTGGVTDEEARTTVVEAANAELYEEMVMGLLADGNPDRPL